MSRFNRRTHLGVSSISSLGDVSYNTAISLMNPDGLLLRQTLLSSGAVSIPSGINFVWAVVVGGGGAGGQPGNYNGGGAGGISWGWTIASNFCIVGAGGVTLSAQSGGYSLYGHIIAGGGNGATNGPGGAAGYNSQGVENFWGQSVGIQGVVGSAGLTSSLGQGNFGGSGYSGGGGGGAFSTSFPGNSTGGAGGQGVFCGGGGGYAAAPASGNTRLGGAGGNSAFYSGGLGSSLGGGGGGAGLLGDGTNGTSVGGNGGLGGGAGGQNASGNTGGVGGAGAILIYY